MKNIVTGSLFALALSVSAGAAQAQNVDVNDIDALTDSDWANIAVNTGFQTEIEADIDISAYSTGKIGGLSTMAAGAVNEGHIAAIGETFDFESTELDIEHGAVDVSGSEAWNGAIATSFTDDAPDVGPNTDGGGTSEAFSGNAAFEESFSFAAHSTDVYYDNVTIASTGPSVDVEAVNAAWNDANIDASVDIEVEKNLGGIDGIDTMAVGAINTGTISMGYSGAALNSAINGGLDD